jgi:hypothetical protein
VQSSRPAAAGHLGSSSAQGYSLVLPPGWRRIPVRSGTRSAIAEIAAEALARVPVRMSAAQAARFKGSIEHRLAETARQARQAGGIDLCLPVEPVHGIAVPASFVVSSCSPRAAGPAGPRLVIDRLLADREDAEHVIVDGVAGIRLESTVAADQAHGIRVGTLRVVYIAPLPGGEDAYLIITFSTPGDGDPHGEFARLLSRLFDSIMLTFRWTTHDIQDQQLRS